jgi:hypothetical protein
MNDKTIAIIMILVCCCVFIGIFFYTTHNTDKKIVPVTDSFSVSSRFVGNLTIDEVTGMSPDMICRVNNNLYVMMSENELLTFVLTEIKEIR